MIISSPRSLLLYTVFWVVHFIWHEHPYLNYVMWVIVSVGYKIITWFLSRTVDGTPTLDTSTIAPPRETLKSIKDVLKRRTLQQKLLVVVSISIITAFPSMVETLFRGSNVGTNGVSLLYFFSTLATGIVARIEASETEPFEYMPTVLNVSLAVNLFKSYDTKSDGILSTTVNSLNSERFMSNVIPLFFVLLDITSPSNSRSLMVLLKPFLSIIGVAWTVCDVFENVSGVDFSLGVRDAMMFGVLYCLRVRSSLVNQVHGKLVTPGAFQITANDVLLVSCFFSGGLYYGSRLVQYFREIVDLFSKKTSIKSPKKSPFKSIAPRLGFAAFAYTLCLRWMLVNAGRKLGTFASRYLGNKTKIDSVVSRRTLASLKGLNSLLVIFLFECSFLQIGYNALKSNAYSYTKIVLLFVLYLRLFHVLGVFNRDLLDYFGLRSLRPLEILRTVFTYGLTTVCTVGWCRQVVVEMRKKIDRLFASTEEASKTVYSKFDQTIACLLMHLYYVFQSTNKDGIVWKSDSMRLVSLVTMLLTAPGYYLVRVATSYIHDNVELFLSTLCALIIVVSIVFYVVTSTYQRKTDVNLSASLKTSSV